MRKWLRQQPEYFYAVGFDALVKQRDKCLSVGGYVEKCMFFTSSNITRFTLYIYLWHIYTCTLPLVRSFDTFRASNAREVRNQMSMISRVNIWSESDCWNLLPRRGTRALSLILKYRATIYIDRLDTPVLHAVGWVLVFLMHNTLYFISSGACFSPFYNFRKRAVAMMLLKWLRPWH
jgi:hypothetical protein